MATTIEGQAGTAIPSWRRDIIAVESVTLDDEEHKRTRFAITERVEVECNGRRVWADQVVGGLLFERRSDAEFFSKNVPLFTRPLFAPVED